jgi:hypothetical protein
MEKAMNWNKVIFLAHASEDKKIVRTLFERLKENGLDPWLDEINLEPGVRWEDKIREAIKESRFFLACISRNSVSKSGFIQKELRIALNELEQKPPGEIYFIPALIDEVELPNISVGTINLRDYHAAKIYEESGLQKLITSLKKHIGIIEQVESKRLARFDDVRNLIADGNIQNAIEMLFDYVKEKHSDFSNNVILISGRYSGLQRDFDRGMITMAEFNANINRITISLLEMMALIEEDIKGK